MYSQDFLNVEEESQTRSREAIRSLFEAACRHCIALRLTG
jgi:hypothetical protein